MDNAYHAILNLPRPRRVRLSRRGKSWLLLLGSVLGGIEILLISFLYSRWNSTGSWAQLVQNHGLPFYSVLLLPFLPFVYRRWLDHQKHLLEQGDVAMATVKSRYRKANRGPYYVMYSFRDSKGDVLEGESLDAEEMLREGSGVLVFYDNDNVDDQVAECAAYYEVIVPSSQPVGAVGGLKNIARRQ
jgi:hypothetical protein